MATEVSIDYQIMHGKPPVWDAIQEKVGNLEKDRENIWCTYGTEIWCESPIPEEILEHEKVHVWQQTIRMSKEEWWDKWLNDLEFRYEQELEGYRTQVAVVKERTKDRNRVFSYKVAIAKVLSGPMYGSIMSFNRVLRDLK